MRLVTWNIISIRIRLDLVAQLARDWSPDVICLQETKCPDELFPREALAKIGYPHQAIIGMKGYHGVAILSRLPLEKPGHLHWCDKEDCRHVFAALPGGIEVHNLYIPAGGDVPDPDENDKFAHKLSFLREQTRWWKGRGKARKPYEFGCKVSIATPATAPKGGQFVLHAKAPHGNPYDGHTLGPVITDLEKLTGVAVGRIHGDKGYRGHNYPDRFRVWISGQVRRVTKVIRREMRRRAAVEPVIGHLKDDHRMRRKDNRSLLI